MSKHVLKAGEIGPLLALFVKLQAEGLAREKKHYRVITIQEAGFDGFWIHRVLEQQGIESHVVDPAAIAVPRKRRNAKTDKVDGASLLRTLMAFKRGEARACAMAVPPSAEDEDRRRISRERRVLKAEVVEAECVHEMIDKFRCVRA